MFPGRLAGCAPCGCAKTIALLRAVGARHAAMMHERGAAGDPGAWSAADWQTHMAEEEALVFPLFRPEASIRLTAEHVVFRRQLAAGGRVDLVLMRAHSLAEDEEAALIPLPALGVPVVGVAAGFAAAYALDVWARDRVVAVRARAAADRRGKPLLNVGSGYVGSASRSSLTGAKLWGDVNCDASAPRDAPCDRSTVCHCDVRDLSRFRDREFGAALASNMLRYVPDRARAEAELRRVADEVFLSDNLLPWPQWGSGPTLPVAA